MYLIVCKQFIVDASQAGEGTLELVVTTRKSSVRAEVLMKSRGLYNVTFVPQEKVSHYINITFNEEDVPGKLINKRTIIFTIYKTICHF